MPPLASGPILCLLGALMCSSVRGIDWDDFQDRGAHGGVALPTVGMILWMEEILHHLAWLNRETPYNGINHHWSRISQP